VGAPQALTQIKPLRHHNAKVMAKPRDTGVHGIAQRLLRQQRTALLPRCVHAGAADDPGTLRLINAWA